MEDPEIIVDPESPKLNASATRTPPFRSGNWVVFWALQAFGFVVCNLILNLGPNLFAEKHVIPTLFGIYYGQTVIAAVLTVFAPWSILKRLTLVPLWIASGTFLAVLFVHQGPGASDGVLLAGLTVFTWMVAQIPFWGTRRLFRLRLRQVDSVAGPSVENEQFSVRQLLIFTLTVAVVLGVGRAIVSHADVQSFFHISPNDAVTFASFVTAMVVTGLLVVHFWLQPRLKAVALLTSTALVLAVVFALRFIFANWVDPGGPTEDYAMLSNAVGGQAIWIAISLLGLRRGGWRLLQVA